eukprot:PhM_4_TR18798/c0_g1_i5/m.77547
MSADPSSLGNSAIELVVGSTDDISMTAIRPTGHQNSSDIAHTPHVVLACFITPCVDHVEPSMVPLPTLLEFDETEEKQKKGKQQRSGASVESALSELPLGYQGMKRAFLLPDISQAFAFSQEPLLFPTRSRYHHSISTVPFMIFTTFGAISGLVGRFIAVRVDSQEVIDAILYISALITVVFLGLQLTRYRVDLMRRLAFTNSVWLTGGALLGIHCANTVMYSDAPGYIIVMAIYAIFQSLFLFCVDAAPYRIKMRNFVFGFITCTSNMLLLSYTNLIPQYTAIYTKEKFLLTRLDTLVFNTVIEEHLVVTYVIMSSYMLVALYRFLILKARTGLFTFGVREIRPIEPRV